MREEKNALYLHKMEFKSFLRYNFIAASYCIFPSCKSIATLPAKVETQ
jgi:hypothetical protein